MTKEQLEAVISRAQHGDERAIQHLAVYTRQYGRKFATLLAQRLPAEHRPEFWEYFKLPTGGPMNG